MICNNNVNNVEVTKTHQTMQRIQVLEYIVSAHKIFPKKKKDDVTQYGQIIPNIIYPWRGWHE